MDIMKYNRFFRVLFILVFSSSFVSGLAYGNVTLIKEAVAEEAGLECGTIMSPIDIEIAKNRSSYESGSELSSVTMGILEALKAPVGIPLAIHVVRYSDGTGGLDKDRVGQAVADTNANYASVKMSFFMDGGIHYINSDKYYSIDNMGEADTLRNTYNIPNRLNIYFVNYAMGYCGFSAYSWYGVQGIIVANGCAGLPSNPSTVPHEIGHYFDLFHTHELVYGMELANGTNCSTAGDLLCDTPADPNLYGKVNTFCEYAGGEVDPNGDPYIPDTYNLMSYSQKTCRDYSSPEQANKEMNTLFYYRPELLVLPDIKANNLDGPVNISAGSPLTVTVSLDSGARRGEAAEWWIAAFAPNGNYWFTLASGWVRSSTPIPVGGSASTFRNLNPYAVLDNYIITTPGSYQIGIAIDSNVNGILDLHYLDTVKITVQ